MRKSILIVAALGLATVLAVHFLNAPAGQQTVAPAAETAVAQTASESTAGTPTTPVARSVVPQRGDGASNHAALSPASPEGIAFAAQIDTLVSPHSTYAEKQAAWNELLASGRIQDAIAELTQRAASDPQNAEIASALGQAYLRACGTTQDVHSQAIWAMQADTSFDTALSLDPSNWDARFTKAMAMTYWPDNLNKGPEVISLFNTLIQQQEKQEPQPQFAQTYDLLGQQYAKAGQTDMAQQVWQHGAALYPDNQALQNRLAPAQTARQ